MGSLIKIGFIGNKTEDIMMYLSRILFNLGKKVSIFDSSGEQLLKYYVPSIDEKSNVTNYRNIDIYSACDSVEDLCKLDFGKYDVVLVNYGYNKDLIDEFSACTYKFMVTDLERHCIMKLKETSSKIGRSIETNRIFRDVVDSKIDQSYIDKLLGNVLIKTLNDYVLFLDEVEMVCRLESQYNDVFKFNKLPKFYKEVLMDILDNLGFDKKSCIKAFKNAEKGG